jgi:hypothetical protein
MSPRLRSTDAAVAGRTWLSPGTAFDPGEPAWRGLRIRWPVFRGQTARRHTGVGPHHWARSSASPPVPPENSTINIIGLQISRGFGGSAPNPADAINAIPRGHQDPSGPVNDGSRRPRSCAASLPLKGQNPSQRCRRQRPKKCLTHGGESPRTYPNRVFDMVSLIARPARQSGGRSPMTGRSSRPMLVTIPADRGFGDHNLFTLSPPCINLAHNRAKCATQASSMTGTQGNDSVRQRGGKNLVS